VASDDPVRLSMAIGGDGYGKAVGVD